MDKPIFFDNSSHCFKLSSDKPALFSRLLPAQLIKKDYIVGQDDCDYEIYMREFVNKSSFFQRKTNQTDFTKPQSEESGQCDGENVSYSLDFKWLLTKTVGMGISQFSTSIAKLSDVGMTLYGLPNITPKHNRYKEVNGTLLFSELAKMNYDELIKYETVNTREWCKESDIREILVNMVTRKNLILLIPLSFYFIGEVKHEKGKALISEFINKSYSILTRYRNKRIKNEYDTYYVYFYDNSIVFLQATQDGLEEVEDLELTCSETYMKLTYYSKPLS